MADITPDNIITHPSLPRNKLIAETLQRIHYRQRSGQGIDIMYREMVSMENHIQNILHIMMPFD